MSSRPIISWFVAMCLSPCRLGRRGAKRRGDEIVDERADVARIGHGRRGCCRARGRRGRSGCTTAAARFASDAGRNRANVGASAAPVEARNRSLPSKVTNGRISSGSWASTNCSASCSSSSCAAVVAIATSASSRASAGRDRGVDRGEDPLALVDDHGVQELLLPAEVAVDGRPGAAGFLGHVFQGRLGHAVAGQRDEGGGDDPRRGRRPTRPHSACRASRAPWSLVRQ